MPTDLELKQVLAKMLPFNLIYEECQSCLNEIERGEQDEESMCNPLFYISPRIQVKDTELLQLCWEVEETLTPSQCQEYDICLHATAYTHKNKLGWFFHTTWQQRVEALAKVKGIKI